MHTLTPITEPYPAEVADIFARYPKGEDGYILRLFRVFGNSVRFLRNKGVANLLDRDSPLSLREREIVILRVTANNDCEYEWGVHVAIFAGAAGFSTEQIEATRLHGPEAPCWDTSERLLIQCVDELCAEGRIGDATYDAFRAEWDLEQQLEILSLCGNYHTISFVANTSRLSNEAFATAFPAVK